MKKLHILTLAVIGFIYACGTKKENPEPTTLLPAEAVLLAPAQNELCTQGTVVSATQSTVTLKWKAAANTENYQVEIKDLEANTSTTQTTTNTQIDVSLKRNMPYSWSVTSKSSNSTATAQSAIWRFYNSGPATVNYAPFPAEIVAPAFGEAVTPTGGKLKLAWTGADVDNDIVNYDVYTGTTIATLSLTKGALTATTFDIDVTSGNTYYWKVITTDIKGNKSDSGIFNFKVN